MEALDPRAGGLYVDGTFGAGGYARALLDRGARVIALDRDPSAIRAGEKLKASSAGQLELVEARFGELDEAVKRLGVGAVDGVVLDIGVSSMQLDEAARGFSLRFDAHLECAWGAAAARPPNPARRGRGDDRRHPVSFRRGAGFAPDRARHRRRPRDKAVHLDTGARGHDRAGGAGAARRAHPSRDARLPGLAHRGQRRARRACARPERRGAAAHARRAPRGGDVPLARRPDRQAVLRRRSGRGRAASRRLPGEPVEAEPTFEVPRGQPIKASEAETSANPCSRSAKLRFGVRLSAPPRGRDKKIEALARLPARRGR